jgi:hypothetical protein
LKEAAAADAGIPHCPAIVKLRVALAKRAGGPKPQVKPLPRVSATRQGFTAMKGRGGNAGLTASARAPRAALAAGGVQKAGAGQFAIASGSAISRGEGALPEMKRRGRTPRNRMARTMKTSSVIS